LKALLTAIATTALACAQSVTGVVKEMGTNQPIEGATVKINIVPDPRPQFVTAQTYAKPDMTLTTAIDGSFSFDMPRFGSVRITASKDGFGPGAPMLKPPTEFAEVTVDKDHPKKSAKLSLARPAVIIAHVIDEETRKPVAKVPLAVLQNGYLSGTRRLIPAVGSRAESDAEGLFTSSKLAPGEYMLQVRPESQQDGAVQLVFAKEDFDKTDSDFARTHWPGGKDLDAAIPVKLRSGDKLDIGTVTVHPTKLYRVKFSVNSASCEPGEMVQVSRVVRTGMATNQTNSTDVPCRGQFLVTRLQPGIYWFEFRTGKRKLPAIERASVKVEVVDKNVEAKAMLSRGIDIAGRFTVEKGASKPNWKKLTMLLAPLGAVPIMSEIPAPPDEEGRFQFVNASAREYRFNINGLPSGYYVKEIRYNGISQAPGWLTLSEGALSQSVEVIVDDKPAAVTGKVKDGEGAQVVLVSWPPNKLDYRSSSRTATADADGKFQIMNLPPGEYRCFAMRAGTERDKLEEPYVLDRMLAAAKKVTVEAGSGQAVELDLLVP
jgi:hypothetical protein